MLIVLRKYWFLISLAIAAWLGYILPEIGEALIGKHVLTVGLVLSFFLTGLLLKSGEVLNAFQSCADCPLPSYRRWLFFPLLPG